jgi:hypothetical protein
LIDHIFTVSLGPTTSEEMRRTLETQRASIMKDQLPMCRKTFDQAMYECIMASSSQDALSKCEKSRKDPTP